VAIAGTAVLLGYSATGGGVDSFDVWQSTKGAYVESWDRTTHVAVAYGPTVDGRSFLGLIFAHPGGGDKETCLAELDPANFLRATATACGLSQGVSERGPVSPDGRYLALQADGEGPGNIVVVDLHSVFQRAAVTAWWDARGPGAWVDATTMIAADRSGRYVGLRIGQATPEPVAGPSPAAAPVYQPVPKLYG
jgi:hypothetical protein